MLYITTGEFTKECIVAVDRAFDFYKRKEWFDDEIVQECIRTIDNSEVIAGEYIESPVWGGMSPDKLSTGCKATILMQVLEEPYLYGTRCGDNCVPLILKIAEKKDVTLLLHHCMHFPDSGFELIMKESGKLIRTQEEFVYEYYRLRNNQ